MTALLGQAPRPRRRLRRGAARLVRGPALERHRLGQWMWRAAAAAGGVAAVVAGVGYLFLAAIHHYRIPFLQLWAAIAALLLVGWLLRGVMPRPVTPAPQPDPAEADLGDRPFAVVDWWQQRLAVTSGDVEWHTRVVRERLQRIVAERLRQRRGVRLDREPESARAILGAGLHDFLTQPLPRTPTPAEMDRIITRIEEI